MAILCMRSVCLSLQQQQQPCCKENHSFRPKDQKTKRDGMTPDQPGPAQTSDRRRQTRRVRVKSFPACKIRLVECLNAYPHSAAVLDYMCEWNVPWAVLLVFLKGTVGTCKELIRTSNHASRDECSLGLIVSVYYANIDQ